MSPSGFGDLDIIDILVGNDALPDLVINWFSDTDTDTN